jgi:hypothetical protein
MGTDFKLIERLARKYYETADHRFVDFREKSIPEIEAAYPVRVQGVNYVSFDIPGGTSIDMYKEIALCIQLCLEKPVFWLRDAGAKPNPSLNTMMINEIFCFDIMRIRLQTLTGKYLDTVAFNRYRYPFLRLLSYYKEHKDFHKMNLFFTFNMAHLIYFIRRDFSK